jgi:3-hydroxyacyl-[acyl-carrier-protein] dehydratase
MPPEFHVVPASLDLTQVVADREAIRRINPQRFEMEQLSAIVLIDSERHLIVGYKDVRPDEFWVRGHMPDYPLLPGVLMCEAAAQLCSFYMISQHLVHTDFVGFGGLEKTRFRHPVHPGDRLVLVAKAEKLNRRQMTFDVQGFVGSTMVFQAEVIGMPMSKKGTVS